MLSLSPLPLSLLPPSLPPYSITTLLPPCDKVVTSRHVLNLITRLSQGYMHGCHNLVVRLWQPCDYFWSLQLDLAENQDRQPSRLSPIYISLARTHIDCAQFSQAEAYYKKELEYCCSTPIEVSDEQFSGQSS